MKPEPRHPPAFGHHRESPCPRHRVLVTGALREACGTGRKPGAALGEGDIVGLAPGMESAAGALGPGELGEITNVHIDGTIKVKNLVTGKKTGWRKPGTFELVSSGMTALHAAAALGHGGVCAAILADARFTQAHARDSRGNTARELLKWSLSQ